MGDKFEERTRTGAAALAAVLLAELEALYSALATSADAEDFQATWAERRDAYKHTLDRIIRRGR